MALITCLLQISWEEIEPVLEATCTLGMYSKYPMEQMEGLGASHLTCVESCTQTCETQQRESSTRQVAQDKDKMFALS